MYMIHAFYMLPRLIAPPTLGLPVHARFTMPDWQSTPCGLLARDLDRTREARAGRVSDVRFLIPILRPGCLKVSSSLSRNLRIS